MLFFLKPNNRNCGKMLMVTSVQSCDDRKSENNTTAKHRQMQEPKLGEAFTVICRLLSVLVALVVAGPTLLAEDRDHDRDQIRFVDPIVGSWIVHVTVTAYTPTLPVPLPLKFDNLSAFFPNGISTGSSPDEGAAYGVWKKIGEKYYTKIITIVPPNFMGIPEGSIDTVLGEHLTLSPPENQLIGPFHGFVTDPSGKVVAQYEGTVVIDRISFTSNP
jgi:hypothetical protein